MSLSMSYILWCAPPCVLFRFGNGLGSLLNKEVEGVFKE